MGEGSKKGGRFMSGDHIPFFQVKEINQNNNVSKDINQKYDDSSIRRRKIRSDKCHSIKFPVTENEQIRMKVACKKADKVYKKIYGYDQKLTQTLFNTLLLQYALKNLDKVNWERNYKDTKLYLHTKPTEKVYELIGGRCLSI